MDFKNTKKALELFARAVVLQAKKNVKREGAVSSGNLEESISYDLTVYPKSFGLEFYMAEYGKFIDEGVKGSESTYYESRNSPFKFDGGKKMIPTKSLDKWLVKKGIAPRGEDGQFISRKSLKFAIATSIYRKGILARKFFSRPFEDEYLKLNQDIIDAFGLDIDEFLDQTTRFI